MILKSFSLLPDGGRYKEGYNIITSWVLCKVFEFYGSGFQVEGCWEVLDL